jgi:ATP-dependent Clp endopeptidase proteolytic subunit ClpP
MKLAYRNERNARALAALYGKPLDKPDWYSMQAATDDGAEIVIYDYIGWPYNDPVDLVRSLGELGPQAVTVRINSPGGDVFDGMAIFNALRGHKGRVTTRIEGVAASMASIIALAGKEVHAYANTFYMIHNPWACVAGDQDDLREVADVIEKMRNSMVDVYAQASGVGKKELRDMMKAETWLTAKEAKEKGFVDTVLDGKGAKAAFDLSVFANVPDGLGGQREGRELTKREIERALRDAGASRSFAESVAAGRGGGGGPGGNQREAEGLQIGAIADQIRKNTSIWRT